MRARGSQRPQPTCDAGAPRRWAVEEAEDSIDVEMGRQQVGDQIKLRVASRADAGVADNESAPAGRIGDTGEPRATEVVVVEQAVPMSAEDGVAHDALWFGVDPEPVLLGTPGEPPMMDFVPGERLVPAAQDLGLAEGDVGVQQPQAGHHPRAGFDRVLDAPAQHLQSPADAQHRLAGPGVIDDRAGQAAIVQPGQVGDGGLAARKHDQVGVGQVGGVGDPAHQHAGLAGQRLDVGGVGDPGQPDRGHPQPLVAARWRGRADDALGNHRQRVLGVQPELVGVWQHPIGRTAGHGTQLAQPGFQQRGVTAEFVDDEAGDQRLVVGLEHRDRPEQMSEQAAAVDVADQDHRQVRGPGQPHVGDIRRPQVYFGRRTGSLADHRVEFVTQRRQFVEDDDWRAGRDAAYSRPR